MPRRSIAYALAVMPVTEAGHSTQMHLTHRAHRVVVLRRCCLPRLQWTQSRSFSDFPGQWLANGLGPAAGTVCYIAVRWDG